MACTLPQFLWPLLSELSVEAPALKKTGITKPNLNEQVI